MRNMRLLAVALLVTPIAFGGPSLLGLAGKLVNKVTPNKIQGWATTGWRKGTQATDWTLSTGKRAVDWTWKKGVNVTNWSISAPKRIVHWTADTCVVQSLAKASTYIPTYVLETAVLLYAADKLNTHFGAKPEVKPNLNSDKLD